MKASVLILFSFFYWSSNIAYSSDLDPASKAASVLEKELNISFDTLGYLVMKTGSTMNTSEKLWKVRGLPWQVKELESKGLIRVKVFETTLNAEKSYMYILLPTKKSIQILKHVKRFRNSKWLNIKKEPEWPYSIQGNLIYETPSQ